MEDLEDVITWVNSVLNEASNEGTTVDAKISSVSMKLQVMSADLCDELEQHMDELQEAAPRALGDIGSVSRSLASVTDELAVVEARVESATATSRESATLDELDRLKTHLEAVGATLREAASWQAAVRRATASLAAFLERGSGAREEAAGAPPWAEEAAEVAARLETVAESEKILRKLPEADERRSTVEALRDDLEGALRPRLAAALDKGESIEGFVGVYEALGLSDELRRAYRAATATCRPPPPSRCTPARRGCLSAGSCTTS